ncbi:MAG: proline--tRNA ligase [Bacilli bacterium]|nr:proline--tRNA ligase [Bacilli bacterium]
MKLKDSFFYTIREDIKDEESISGKLLVKSGMIKKTSNGIYMYMPLGLKTLEKIKTVIRRHMNEAGASELLMPCLLPEEIYIASGRRENFGSNMFTLKDRYNRAYSLGPTHEELFVEAAKMKIKSYKDMPFNIYQIGNKYRDETRPRYGLIRVREFFMKDAYSFDTDLETLNVSYQKMFEAYKHIFDEIGINYKIVRADTGAMGGLLSEEFQAVTDIGEDVLVLCSSCDYASNIEVSECVENKQETKEALLPKELIETKGHGTVEQLVHFLDISADKVVKTLIYQADDKFYACMVAGDREINELKLSKLLNVAEVTLADYEDVKRITNAEIGFAGPIGLNIPIIIDHDVLHMHNFLVGANKTDYHYINVNISDFSYDMVADIKNVKEGDVCPKCGAPLLFKKGIEIGNTFKLGTKYSESLHLEYLDSNNELHPVVMGCYGIGLGRIFAATIEQNNDENGIIWPISIAPYQVAIVLINDKDEKQMEVANFLYETFSREGIDVLLDDRDERPGVKFKDMDLIGIPIRITVGKKVVDNLVEWKFRQEDSSIDMPIEEVVSKVKEVVKE